MRVLFKDTNYDPCEWGDSDCSFLVDIKAEPSEITEYLDSGIYEDSDAWGDYSYEEWVYERLEELGWKYEPIYEDMTMEW